MGANQVNFKRTDTSPTEISKISEFPSPEGESTASTIVYEASSFVKTICQLNGYFIFTQDRKHAPLLKYSSINVPSFLFYTHLILGIGYIIFYHKFKTNNANVFKVNGKFYMSSTEEYSYHSITTLVSISLICIRILGFVTRNGIQTFYSQYFEVVTGIFDKYRNWDEIKSWIKNAKKPFKFVWLTILFGNLFCGLAPTTLYILVLENSFMKFSQIFGFIYGHLTGLFCTVFAYWLVTLLICISIGFRVIRIVSQEFVISNAHANNGIVAQVDAENNLKWFLACYNKLGEIVQLFNTTFAFQLIISLLECIILLTFHAYAIINIGRKNYTSQSFGAFLCSAPLAVCEILTLCIICYAADTVKHEVGFFVIIVPISRIIF